MKVSSILFVVIALGAAGGVYSYFTVFTPLVETLDRPTDEQATAAWRRVRSSISGRPSFPNVTVKLEKCEPSPQIAAVTCFGEIDWGDGKPEKRPMQFAKLNGAWVRPGE